MRAHAVFTPTRGEGEQVLVRAGNTTARYVMAHAVVGPSVFFTRVRSIWLPTNGTMRYTTTIACAAGSACAAFLQDGKAMSHGHVSLCIAAAVAFSLQIVMLCGLRELEELEERFTDDEKADRRAMPLIAVSLPAALLAIAGVLGIWACQLLWPRSE